MSPEAPTQETYKMSYIPAQYRVRVEISQKYCKSLEHPPKQMFEKARAKLESEKQAGRIAFYHIYERRLLAVWSALRQQPDLEQATVAVTLACGAPEIPGIQVEVPSDTSMLACVSIDAPIDEIRAWRIPLFKFVIHKQMRALNIKGMPDPATIHAIWLKACDFGKVEKANIPALRGPSNENLEPYEFLTSADKKELHLLVRSFKDHANTEFIRGILQRSHQEIVKLSNQSGKSYHYLKADLIRSLRSALRGPERLDIDVPFVLLISRIKADEAIEPPHTEALHDFYEISVSEDMMGADITEFNNDIYEQTTLDFSVNNLLVDLEKQGFCVNISQEQLESIKAKITAKESLKGTRIATGQAPLLAEDPYIHFDFQTKDLDFTGKKAVNIRDMQQRKIAQKDDLVASIRFKKSGQEGKDVFGKHIPSPKADISSIQIGEGLQTDDKLRIYAAVSGMPLLESDKSISISKSYVHAGNVNLGSGNIRFDGPIHIQGNVERGALITSSSMVTVDGLVEAASIHCLGDLKVAGGIIGDGEAKILVGGDMSAQFLDNVEVRCHGNITVERGIVASHIKCSKSVTISGDSSNLVGGSLIIWEELSVANLGKNTGASTKVFLGASWKELAKIEKYQGRLHKFQQWLQTLNLELEKQKNHKRLDPNERSKAPVLIEKLKSKIAKCEVLSQKTKRDLSNTKRQRAVNMQAKINVRQNLSSNCEIDIQGKTIAIAAELTTVQVVMNGGSSGNHIRQLNEHSEARAS